MKTYQVVPDPDCKYCQGSGEIVQSHPYGSTTADEWLLCDCVANQLPEDIDYKDEVEITKKEQSSNK